MGSKIFWIRNIEDWKLEANSDCFRKDHMFYASFAFCVITYEPIEVQTFSAPQNHRQNLGFVKDIKVVVKKITKNCRKMIKRTADTLLCPLHSIQFLPLLFLPLCWAVVNLSEAPQTFTLCTVIVFIQLWSFVLLNNRSSSSTLYYKGRQAHYGLI